MGSGSIFKWIYKRRKLPFYETEQKEKCSECNGFKWSILALAAQQLVMESRWFSFISHLSW